MTRLQRQALIANGSLVLIASIMVLVPYMPLAGKTGIVLMGASLIYSGFSGVCGWVPILARAPWNRTLFQTPAIGSTQADETHSS